MCIVQICCTYCNTFQHLQLQGCFYCVRWHGQGRCYGNIFWSVVRVCSSLYTQSYIHAQHAAYSDPLCMYVVHCTHSELRARTTCSHNTDLVHVNGHDRIILVIFSQAQYNAPWWWILCDPKYVGALLNIL